MLLMLLMLAIVLAPGCKDDDDDDKTPANHMTIADKSYEMSQAVLENYGQFSGTGYNFDLLLLSPGLVLHEVNGEIDSISGIGHALSFEIFTATEEMLAPASIPMTPTEPKTPELSTKDQPLWILTSLLKTEPISKSPAES